MCPHVTDSKPLPLPQHLIPAVFVGMAINIALLLVFYWKRLSGVRHRAGPTLWCCPFLPSRKQSSPMSLDAETAAHCPDVIVMYALESSAVWVGHVAAL